MMLNNTMQCYAICTYLKGYGYKSMVNEYDLIAYVQDPVDDKVLVLPIPTWDTAREFIKVRSQS